MPTCDKLFLFHHDPSRDDKAVDEMVEAARMLVLESGKPMEVDAAREGCRSLARREGLVAALSRVTP